MQRWASLWNRRRLLVEASLALLGAGLRVSLTRGASLAAALGKPAPGVGLALSAQQVATAREVAWAIELLALRGPCVRPASGRHSPRAGCCGGAACPTA